jgi:REP element-mobilizing transposase RayT
MSSLVKKMKKIDYYIPLYKDTLYHIYNRGNGKEKIFFKEENYFYFLRQYEKYLSESIDTFAYCLLPNHFHLLGRVKHDNPHIVRENFRKFFISYSMSINAQEKRKGNLFQRGFKRKIIENEKYFYSAVYYIHANPIHHRLIKDLTQYKFSSFNTLCSDNITKLCRNEVIDWFGGKNNFIKFHKEMKNNFFNDDYMIEE